MAAGLLRTPWCRKLLKEDLKGMPTRWSGVARACSVVLVLGMMQVDQGCSMPDRQLLA